MQEVTIIEMEHHFLYLPVYFARDRAFFEQIPEEYTTKIVQASGATDADTFRRLSRGEADIAICDPCAMIYAAERGFVPAVLAGLISRGAFWAVDTKSADVNELHELAQFQHIVTFYPGTTAHGIASRILRLAKGPQPVIESVRPLQEFSRLEDLLNAQKSAVALSPDVLRIEKFVDTNRDKGWDHPVKLALAETIEYGHLLVTAVIARPEFVVKNAQFINGFLKALQQALIRVRVGDPQVLSYATESFSQKELLVTKALKRANDAQIWASDITISLDVWLNAVQAHYDSLGQPFDANARREALRLFEESFKPYVEGARSAAVDLVSDPRRKSLSRVHYSLLLLAGMITGVAAILVWQDHSWAQLILAFSIAYLPIVSNYRRRKHLLVRNAIMFVLFTLVWFLHIHLHRLSDEGYVGSIMVLFLVFVEENFRVILTKSSNE
jgi:hypothetical protein